MTVLLAFESNNSKNYDAEASDIATIKTNVDYKQKHILFSEDVAFCGHGLHCQLEYMYMSSQHEWS